MKCIRAFAVTCAVLTSALVGMGPASADGGNEYTDYSARDYGYAPYYDDYGPAYGYNDGYYYDDGYYGGAYDDGYAYGGGYDYYEPRRSVHIQFSAPGFYFSFGN